MKTLNEKIVKIANAQDWEVDICDNGDGDYTFAFQKYSLAGQDFNFEADMEDNNIQSLLYNIHEYYSNYDCSENAYLWLDETGHGKNGAPYDMKDVYEDMEACKQYILDLYDILRKEDLDTIN